MMDNLAEGKKPDHTSRCVAHGINGCAQCHLSKPGSITPVEGRKWGTCNGCGRYGDTGTHWDTCPNRAFEIYFGNDSPRLHVEQLRKRVEELKTDRDSFATSRAGLMSEAKVNERKIITLESRDRERESFVEAMAADLTTARRQLAASEKREKETALSREKWKCEADDNARKAADLNAQLLAEKAKSTLDHYAGTWDGTLTRTFPDKLIRLTCHVVVPDELLTDCPDFISQMQQRMQETPAARLVREQRMKAAEVYAARATYRHWEGFAGLFPAGTVARKVVALHRPDDQGNCSGCDFSGDGERVEWPCSTTRVIAETQDWHLPDSPWRKAYDQHLNNLGDGSRL